MFHVNHSILAIGASVFAAAAVAGDYPSPVVETKEAYATVVQFDDLSIDRPAGAETLYERLESAARRVCNLQERTGSFREAEGRNRCHADSLRRAVEGIGNQHLTELYVRRSGSR
jgi:UrcA family protein